MKIECNQYVRTKNGISRVVSVVIGGGFGDDRMNYYDKKDLLCRPSFNIIDLIGPDDIVLFKVKSMPSHFEMCTGRELTSIMRYVGEDRFNDICKIKRVITKEEKVNDNMWLINIERYINKSYKLKHKMNIIIFIIIFIPIIGLSILGVIAFILERLF